MSMNQLFGSGQPPKWVSGTTYAEGAVVWSPTNTQYYTRKNGQGGAGTTDPITDTTNWVPSGDRAVKSVQRGAATALVTAITISAVDISKCQTYVNGYGKDGSGIVQGVIGGYLSNSTTLAVGGNAAWSGGGGIYWEVIERF